MSANDIAIPVQTTTCRKQNLRVLAHRVIFASLAAFILFSPAPGQLFAKHSPWLREWIMYSGVGIGIPQGEFRIHDNSGRIFDTLTPLEAAGLSRYPNVVHYQFDGRMRTSDDLGRYAAMACSTLEDGQWLAFDGRVGTRQGWLPFQVDEVCSAAGEVE